MAMQTYIAQLRIRGALIPIEIRADSLDHARKLIRSSHGDAVIINLQQKH